MTILFTYILSLTLIVMIRECGTNRSLNSFLLADRRLSGIIGSMSVAASWIWAPAIFISTKIGFDYGPSALVWFCLPNMLALIVFAPLAASVRKRMPEGFSYIDYARKFGGNFYKIQLLLQLVMQVVIYAIQLSAGASLLSALEPSGYYKMAIFLAIAPMAYVSMSGLKTSVFTDAIQYLVILSAVILIILFFPFASISKESTLSSFNVFDYKMLIEFGISSALGLIVAIFADQQQWQRAFAAREETLVRTFILAGFFHLLVTVGLGTFGYLIAQTGFSSKNSDMVGLNFITQLYPSAFQIIFIIMALGALISTLDSCLCAFSSLWTTQIQTTSSSLNFNRKVMLIFCLLGAAIACIKLPLISLWFIAGTLRLSSFAPTVFSIVNRSFSGKTGSLAIVLGLLVGAPVLGYGMLTGSQAIRTVGMISTVIVSTATILGWSRKID